MNVAAADALSDQPTAKLIERFYPYAPVKKPFGEFETLLSNEKLKRLLGRKQAYKWRGQAAK